jgi:hypothetical protein
MICDGVCTRSMHRLLDGVFFLWLVWYRLSSDMMIAVIGYWWM